MIAGGEDSGLDPQMRAALLVCFAAFLLLFLYMMKVRIAVQRAQDELLTLRNQIEERA